MSMTQENIWNLSRLEIGMKQKEVRRIMHDPYKTQIIADDHAGFEIWFYVTRPAALDQNRLVRQNVTPLTFENGVLQGWGFEYYDKVVKNKTPRSQEKTPAKKKSLDQAIEELETKPTSALYRPQEGLTGLTQAIQSPIDSNEESRWAEVAYGQNLSIVTERGIFFSQNKTMKKVQSDEEQEEEECLDCEPKKTPLSDEDEQMLDEADEQNFNFW